MTITDGNRRAALASLIRECSVKGEISWKEAVDEADRFLSKYTAPPNISDEKLRETWEGIKSLIASFEIQAEVSKENLHNNCPVSTYYPIIEAALEELILLRSERKV